MISDTFVSKAQINIGTVYLKLQWKQNDTDLFHLQIFSDNGKSWSGVYSNVLAQTYIDDLFQTEVTYYANTKKCMTGEGGDEFKLNISINGEDSAKFCWKKRHESFFQEQGSMTLNLDNDTISKTDLIDLLIDENKTLRTVISKMDQKTEEMDADLLKCKTELEKYVNIKSSIEATLYAKFVQLLNTKKHRIQSLEEQLLKYMD